MTSTANGSYRAWWHANYSCLDGYSGYRFTQTWHTWLRAVRLVFHHITLIISLPAAHVRKSGLDCTPRPRPKCSISNLIAVFPACIVQLSVLHRPADSVSLSPSEPTSRSTPLYWQHRLCSKLGVSTTPAVVDYDRHDTRSDLEYLNEILLLKFICGCHSFWKDLYLE